MALAKLKDRTRELNEQAWCWLVRNIALPAGDIAFHQRMIPRLRFIEQAQWWPTEKLYAYRDRQLAELIATAYREVPFYRALMNQAGVSPDEIKSAADLIKLPVVTKDMLLSGYPDQVTRPTGQKTYEVHTSGSTGKNFAVREDAETAGLYRASFVLTLKWAGWEIGRPHLQTGMTLNRTFDRRLKDAMLRCHYVSAFDLDDAHLDIALDIMEQRNIEHLWGYAASLYHLARRAIEKGWNRPMRSVVTWGDNLYPQFRREIELAFRTHVSDTYGIGEGMQVSAQCGEGENYHVHNVDVIVEYLDDAGNPVPSGEPGNLILTRLHPGPMPLIRYQVGDVGIAGDQSPCACGRGLDRMKQILGRDSDVVLTPSGNRLIVEFFNGIFDDFPEVNEFQVVQDSIDAVHVALVPNRDFSEKTSRALIAAMQNNGAADLTFHINCVNEIPLTPGGKRRFVINKMPKRESLLSLPI